MKNKYKFINEECISLNSINLNLENGVFIVSSNRKKIKETDGNLVCEEHGIICKKLGSKLLRCDHTLEMGDVRTCCGHELSWDLKEKWENQQNHLRKVNILNRFLNGQEQEASFFCTSSEISEAYNLLNEEQKQTLIKNYFLFSTRNYSNIIDKINEIKKSEINNLKSEIDILKIEITNLKSEINNLKANLEKINQTVEQPESLKETFEKLKSLSESSEKTENCQTTEKDWIRKDWERKVTATLNILIDLITCGMDFETIILRTRVSRSNPSFFEHNCNLSISNEGFYVDLNSRNDFYNLLKKINIEV